MGSDVSEVHETPTRALGTKVHMSMCAQLRELIDRISSIIPDIEAAKPRCSQGLHALSQLHVAVETARERLQNCCMSSKLYLAIKGEVVKSRFEKAKNHMERSLSQLQNMVPVALKLEMSVILVDLRGKKFSVDSCEELAGKALRAILQQDVSPIDSVGNSEIELLQFAASMLHLTSQKDLVIERRCLKRLLNDVKEENSDKKKILKYLLHLLRKYSKLILQGKTGNFAIVHDVSVKSDSKSMTTQSHDSCVGHVSFLRRPDPPEGFKCPLSSRLMHDPVIISSGQTYERAYIQKRFDDGHDTCPKTRMKLSNLSLTSNTPMRELILKWCMEYGIPYPDPSIVTSINGSLESSNSFRSTASSMNDIDLRVDMSNLSLGSLDCSYSNISHVKYENSFGSIKELSVVEPRRFQFYPSIDDIRTQFLSNVRELPWELQCTAIQDVTNYLIDFNPCALVSSENFLDPLILFLGEALDKQDREAQKSGSQLLLTFLQAKRREPIPLNEDVYTLLASFLETEVAAERDLQESALKILYILSSKIGSSCKFGSDWVPKLVPFLEDSSVAGTCLGILENLCQFEAIRIAIAETQGCIASIAKLLEKCSCRDQEHAVSILLNLCSQHEYYCQMVMRENCISALYNISVQGSDNGKAIASELLRQLMDTSYEEDKRECPRSNVDVCGGRHVVISDQRSSKSSGFIRRLFKRK